MLTWLEFTVLHAVRIMVFYESFLGMPDTFRSTLQYLKTTYYEVDKKW